MVETPPGTPKTPGETDPHQLSQGLRDNKEDSRKENVSIVARLAIKRQIVGPTRETWPSRKVVKELRIKIGLVTGKVLTQESTTPISTQSRLPQSIPEGQDPGHQGPDLDSSHPQEDSKEHVLIKGPQEDSKEHNLHQEILLQEDCQGDPEHQLEESSMRILTWRSKMVTDFLMMIKTTCTPMTPKPGLTPTMSVKSVTRLSTMS